VQQEETVVHDAIAVAHQRREHVPVAQVDDAREIPAAADHVAALAPHRLPLRERDAGGDDRLGVGAPDFLLYCGSNIASR
jgi:hypothetical protein